MQVVGKGGSNAVRDRQAITFTASSTHWSEGGADACWQGVVVVAAMQGAAEPCWCRGAVHGGKLSSNFSMLVMRDSEGIQAGLLPAEGVVSREPYTEPSHGLPPGLIGQDLRPAGVRSKKSEQWSAFQTVKRVHTVEGVL